MKYIVQEVQIFGPITSFLNYIVPPKILHLEAHENYQKRSFRNKYRLAGPNGIVQESIPLIKGKNNGTLIKDVKISYDTSWPNQHINSIKTCYGSAPYFLHYADEVFELISSREESLFNLSLASLQLMNKLLDLRLEIYLTESYLFKYENAIDIRNKINLKSQSKYDVAYNQVFEEKFGFRSGLSILDVLFCLGPESRIWLEKNKLENRW
jgi:hypothetical protein